MSRRGEVVRADIRVVIVDLDTLRYFPYYGDKHLKVGEKVNFETDAGNRYVQDLQKS